MAAAVELVAMASDQDRTKPDHPWWQRRMSTGRGPVAAASFYSVMAVAWMVVIAPSLLEGPGGWRVPVAVVFGVGWVLLAVAHVTGAAAQRREGGGLTARQ